MPFDALPNRQAETKTDFQRKNWKNITPSNKMGWKMRRILFEQFPFFVLCHIRKKHTHLHFAKTPPMDFAKKNGRQQARMMS